MKCQNAINWAPHQTQVCNKAQYQRKTHGRWKARIYTRRMGWAPVIVWLESRWEMMLRRLESRFSLNGPTRVRVVFTKSPNISLTNSVNLHTKKWAILLQWRMIIMVAIFLLWLCLLTQCRYARFSRSGVPPNTEVELSVLFTECPATHSTLDTLSWFNVVLTISWQSAS